MNAMCVYDFTDNNFSDLSLIKGWCKEYCKKWSFVGEQGTSTMRKHWQGRISLKIKKRLNAIPNPLKFHFSITSKSNKDNTFYIEKGDTAITPIYSDTDEEIYIPKQIREISSLYPWQEQIIQQSKIWDTRSINVVYCKTGNIGKTTLMGWIRAYRLGRCLPVCNDYKDMLRMVCDIPTSTMYCIDMPRALNKDRLYGFYSAIETIKDGYAYDDRYKFKEKIFDCPNIWIFSNLLPDASMLSNDRWKIWEVDNNKVLIPYEEEDFLA
jgi:hypothetical protein